MINLKDLRAKAEAATHPWITGKTALFTEPTVWCAIGPRHPDEDGDGESAIKLTEYDAAYLGVANPQNVLALIEALEVAEKALDEATYQLERIRDADWGAEQMRLGATSGAYQVSKARAQIRALMERG